MGISLSPRDFLTIVLKKEGINLAALNGITAAPKNFATILRKETDSCLGLLLVLSF
jgi:hypothetical protein